MKHLFEIIQEKSGYWRVYTKQYFVLDTKFADEIIKNYEKDCGLYCDNHFDTEHEAELFLTNYVEPYVLMKKLSGELWIP